MKRTLFVLTTILFFALALTSCKKDETNNNSNNNDGGGSSAGYVDLGLPSGTKWSSVNATEKSNVFYTYEEAVSTFGDKLPTKEQFEELRDNCIWAQLDDGSFKVTGTNGNSVVFPAVGYCDCDGNVCCVGSGGGCWSSTSDSGHAWCLLFDSIEVGVYSNTTCNGRSVRLVKK